MILAEANVVTGSFYHFFPSKEALFESVIERFLKNYTDRVTNIFTDKKSGYIGSRVPKNFEIKKVKKIHLEFQNILQ